MASLSLNLFGSVRMCLDEQPFPDLPTKKALALLIYLAIEHGEHHRGKVMTLLWPGMPDRSARHNLRQTAYYLRQQLPELAQKPVAENGDQKKKVPLLMANRQTIALNPAADFVVDAGLFEAILAGTQIHEHVDLMACHHCLNELKKAIDLYQGDFLADFYLEDSNQFEEWSEVQRELYRRRMLDALEILTRVTTGQKEYAQAERYARRQLNIDNLRESAHRQLMEILVLSGRRQEALSVYESYRLLLVEELGMEPANRTTAMYEKIVAGEIDLDPPLAQGVKGYELQGTIGQGAYGAIHRAVQPAIGREVAVKVIRRTYANDPEFIRRFEAEAQTIARLEHPHIVPLYDYWRDSEGAYLVMRYLRGGNLQSALKPGPWPAEQAARMLDQMAGALAAAHLHGIIHRDIKPANILLDESGNAYLSDFGIAKNLKDLSQITAAGAVIGTPDYISPEQIRDEPLGPQTDIYSLGAVLYEILTGEKPFPDSSMANVIYKHLNESIPPVTASRPDLSPAIDVVVQRATAKRPADRYASALEMAEAFRRAVGEPEMSLAGDAPLAPVPEAEVYNPYKGLRAFQEADAADFFGRDDLTGHLLSRLAGSRFLALVGPSGSGKSSAVKAGLIPALRDGAILANDNVAASDKWFVAEMMPGTHPLEELELALWPIAVNPPPSLVEPMQRDTRGMLRTLRRILPDEDNAQLLLVIDQFEELFTQVEDVERRDFFLDSLLVAVRAPRSPLRVVITLRADFYDRPLQYESLGRLLKDNSEIVLPLTAEELTWAVREPARRVGVGMEKGLAETIVADVGDQTGALPLLQYALTELFERRQDRLMTRDAYEEIGGVLGALGRRAEETYGALDERNQAAARQLFLRLVTLGEGVEDTRRRVLRSELEAIVRGGSETQENDGAGGQRLIPDPQSPIPALIDIFGAARLLTFDRDIATRRPTVEVAHEALLREWPRLRAWLDESRYDIRLQRLLAQTAGEWEAAGRDAGYLLRGARLDQLAGWPDESTVSLTGGEKAFLAASIEARAARLAEEESRRRRELATAQKLAETERARADEQAQAAWGLRRRAYILAGVLVVAVLLAAAASYFARQSSQNAAVAQDNAALASTREAEALTEAEQRAIAQKVAEDTAQVAFSRELAAAALSNLDVDPELSILLALQATGITRTLEAENVLHRAVQESRIVDELGIRRWLGPPSSFRFFYAVYSPDRSRLFVSGFYGGRMYDAEAGGLMFKMELTGWIKHAEFSPDSSLLAIPKEASQEGDSPPPGEFAIIRAETGEELVSFLAHDNFAQLATFSPDGRHLVTTSLGEVRVWDVAALLAGRVGEPLLDLEGHDEIVWMARYDAGGQRLATGGDNRTFVWDAQTGEQLLALDIPSSDVIFSPDGSLLLTAYFETVDGWDIESGEKVFTTHAHADSIESMRLSPDGTTLATMGVDGKVKVFDYNDEGLRERLTLAGHAERVATGEFSLDGNLLTTVSVDGTIRIWDVSPHGTDERPPLTGHDDWLFAVAYSPDGKRLVTASGDGTARVWDTQSGETILTLKGHSARVNDATFSPDGKRIATAGEDAQVILWDAGTGQQILVISDHEPGDVGNFFNGVMAVTFSPDGQKIATAGTDGQAKVFDVSSGRQLLSLQADRVGDKGITAVAFSPDGQLLAAGSEEPGIVRIWRLSTGQPISNMRLWVVGIRGLAFSPDGRYLAASDNSGMLSVWQLGDESGGSGITASDIQLLPKITAHNASALGLSISPDGSKLATASPDGSVKVWDMETGQRLLEFEHASGLLDTAFSPDGRYLATGGVDQAVHFFILDRDELIDLAQSRVTRDLNAEECRQYLHMVGCPETE